MCWAILGTVPGHSGLRLYFHAQVVSAAVGVGVTEQAWRHCCRSRRSTGPGLGEVIRWRIGISPARWREVPVALSSGTTGSHGVFQSMSWLMGQLWACHLFLLCFVCFILCLLVCCFAKNVLHVSMVRKGIESIFCDM